MDNGDRPAFFGRFAHPLCELEQAEHAVDGDKYRWRSTVNRIRLQRHRILGGPPPTSLVSIRDGDISVGVLHWYWVEAAWRS